MEFTLLWAALLAVGSAWIAARLVARLDPESRAAGDLADRLLGAVLVGLAVGRVAAMIGDGVNPLTHPGDLLIVRAGVATGPASLAAIAFVAVSARRDLVATLDAAAAPALAGLGGWHAGCLFRGSCLGTPSDLPWAWAQAGSPITRHPVELYAALGLLAAAALVLLVWHRRRPPLVPAGLALAAAGGIRLATDPLRPSLTGGPTEWYVAAIVVGVVAAVAGAAGAARRAPGDSPQP